MIKFFLPMIPPTTTHQMKRVSTQGKRAIIFEDENLKDARQKLTAHLSAHKIDAPLKGSLRLITRWCFPIKKGRYDGQYKDTRPDTDNLIKLLKDCMTEVGFWKDDAQVASELTEKFWANIPGIYIEIQEVQN